MKRKMFFIAAISAALVFGLAGCGGEEQEQAQLQETEYRMTFANQTGRDVSRLEIRPSAESDWQEISLSETEWKSNYEMPIALKGFLPETEEGWQVQMTFVDGSQNIWDSVAFADEETITFSLADGITLAEVQMDETDVPLDESVEQADSFEDSSL